MGDRAPRRQRPVGHPAGRPLRQFGAVLAHGVGGRSDLPLPVWLFAYGAGSALLISFVTLHILWRRPRLDALSAGVSAPAWMATMARPAAFATRALGLLAFGVVLAAAWFGDKSPAANIAPILVYVIFWVGLQAGSFLFGDIWSRLSPWDTLALGFEKLRSPRRTGAGETGAGERAGTHWPAALGIAGFVWMELCYHDPSSPRVLGVALALYSMAMVVVVARHGRARLRTADPFAAWFALLAAMAPLFRDDHGAMRLRWPFAGLASVRPRSGTLGLVMVVLGSTAFDGLSRTAWWRDIAASRVGWGATAVATPGLAATVTVMLAVYVAAMNAAGRISGRGPADLRVAFLSSLVPIALAYAIGHYFSLFMFEGQQAIAMASDPFGRGWDLFGTIDRAINYRLLSTDLIAWVQVSAIVTGHVAGVVVAHDRAVSRFELATATRSQLPLLAVMVTYTVGGLALLLGA